MQHYLGLIRALPTVGLKPLTSVEDRLHCCLNEGQKNEKGIKQGLKR